MYKFNKKHDNIRTCVYHTSQYSTEYNSTEANFFLLFVFVAQVIINIK